MNIRQRKILQGGLLGIAISLLFPPFKIVWINGAEFGLGFGFIFSWPEMSGRQGTVDVSFLMAEWLALCVVCSILWKLNENPDDPSAFQILTRLVRSFFDVHMEATRVLADAKIRAAEIDKKK